jgi:hypothetical protein
VGWGAGLGLLVLVGAWFSWWLIGARSRPFAVVLDGELISRHRTEKQAENAFAKALGESAVSDRGETAGLPWAVLDGTGPGRRYSVIDQRQRDRRRRPRPRDAARKKLTEVLVALRLREPDPFERRR